MIFNKVIGQVDNAEFDYTRVYTYVDSPLECKSLAMEYTSGDNGKVTYVKSYEVKFYIKPIISAEDTENEWGQSIDESKYELRCINLETNEDTLIKTGEMVRTDNITSLEMVCEYVLDGKINWVGYYIKNGKIFEIGKYSDSSYRYEDYRDIKVFNTNIGEIATTTSDFSKPLDIRISRDNVLSVFVQLQYGEKYNEKIANVSENAYIYGGGVTTDGKFVIEIRE